MLIKHQKFRLHMIGHYNRSCHIITCNMHKMGGLIYSCAMRAVPTSCLMLLHVTHVHRQAGRPYVNVVYQKYLMDMLFEPAKRYLSKLTASYFNTLNMNIANQNMLKRILIAMQIGNKANCNENFRLCAEDPMGPLYKW